MTKEEILKHTLEFLKNKPDTQIYDITNNINQILEREGLIGRKQEHRAGATYFTEVRTPDRIALLVNEVVYDLLYQERILTPGVNAANLELPFVHVSNMQKLEGMLND